MCISKEQFIQSQQAWKSVKEHSSLEHIIYNVIRGKDADRGFVPIQGTSKIISNSCDKWNGFNQPLRRLKSYFTCTSVWQKDRCEATLKSLEKTLGITFTDELKAVILEIKENR